MLRIILSLVVRLIVTRTRVTGTDRVGGLVLRIQWRHPMLLMETSVGLVPVYRTRVKTRIVNLPRGEDESEMVNAYFVMNFISYGTVNNLRRNPLRIE